MIRLWLTPDWINMFWISVDKEPCSYVALGMQVFLFPLTFRNMAFFSWRLQYCNHLLLQYSNLTQLPPLHILSSKGTFPFKRPISLSFSLLKDNWNCYQWIFNYFSSAQYTFNETKVRILPHITQDIYSVMQSS